MKLPRLIRQKSLFSIYLFISYLIISCVWPSLYVEVVAADMVHDIAITSVAANATAVAPGETVEVIVTVENQGGFEETFNVSAYYNSSIIETQNDVSLNPANSTVLTFLWDTTGVPVSTNLIKANATVVPGEIETTDNEYIGGTVAVTWTEVYISPTLVSKNEPEYFAISINILNVTDLYSYSIRLKWKLGLLYCQNVVEGPFLSKGGTQDTWWVPPIIENAWSPPHVVLGNLVKTGGTGVNGSGTLATLVFQVMDTGNVTLELYMVALRDNATVPMRPNTGSPDYWFEGLEHGYFYTTNPVASFTISPDPGTDLWRPVVHEPVTFNATVSYDPDDPYDSTPDGITSYYWDFDDGTNVTTYDTVTTHTFTASGQHVVSLTVTDDEGETDTDTYRLDVKLHDIALVNVTAYPAEVAAGATMTINATVVNEGSIMEFLNITVYYNYDPIEERIFSYTSGSTVKVTLSPGKNGTCTIPWNTTHVAPGTYMIGAKVSLIRDSSTYRGVSLDEWEADKTDNTMFAGLITIFGTPVHDIAVTDVAVDPDPVNIPRGQVPYIDVTVKNEGNTDETFNATVYCNSTLIGANTDVTLSPGESTTLTFAWTALTGANTTQEGSYNIMANVTLINNETDTADNSRNITRSVRLLPYAMFTYSPTTPAVGELVEFDASSSYSPGIPVPGEPPGTIESYEWGFGDGTTSVGQITQHTYNTRRPYTVTLTVTDNEGLSRTYWKSVSVGHDHDVAVTDVTPSSTEATTGEQVSVNVTVTNQGLSNETFTINVYYDDTTAASVQSVTDLAPRAETTLTFIWNTAGVGGGTYLMKAVASPVTGETFLKDNALTGDAAVTILKLSSNITLSASPTTLTIGESTTLVGSITPSRSGVNVMIWIRASGEDWGEHVTVTSDANGSFSHSWTPPSAGSYGVKVSWLGDDETHSAESDVHVINVQEALTSNMFLYSTIALAILSGVIVVYFIWIRKPKPA